MSYNYSKPIGPEIEHTHIDTDTQHAWLVWVTEVRKSNEVSSENLWTWGKLGEADRKFHINTGQYTSSRGIDRE